MNLFYNEKPSEDKPCIAHVSYSDADSFGAVWGSERRGIMPFAPRGISFY